MDFDKILSHFRTKACILSVEYFPDGSYGNIRVVAGNELHRAVIEVQTNHPFVPNTPYEDSFTKNPNFEDHCYRCTHFGIPIHAYVNLYMLGLWLNIFLIPLESDKKNIRYCIYCYDVTPKADIASMADLSMETSSEVLKTCIKLRSSNNIEETFNEVVHDISKICDAEHCCILLTDSENRSCRILGEALSEGTKHIPMQNYLDGFYQITETWSKMLEGSSCVIIKNESEMAKLRKDNPLWGESLAKANVKSMVLFPLRLNNTTHGYMWAIDFNVNDILKIKETLELTTFFLSSEISSYLLMKKMEIMSNIDSLTNILNRNVMNNRVDEIVAGQRPVPVAVFFADLNGLKRLNDEQGHSAGDKMLFSAASILKEVFHDGEVFRAGGDEFMILVPDIPEDEIQKRVAQIHQKAQKTEFVCFSIGTCYGEKDIRTAMRLADERMYADKEEYYKAHPELKYR